MVLRRLIPSWKTFSLPNAIQHLRGKARAYLDAGATEAWIVFPRSRRIEFYGKAGAIDRTQFELDLSHVFD